MAEQWRRISVLDDGVDISPSRHLLADDIPLLLLHGAYQARYLREIPYIAASFSANRWRSNRLPGSLSHNFFFFKLFAASITSRTTRHALIAPTGDYSHLDKWDYIGKFLAVP